MLNTTLSIESIDTRLQSIAEKIINEERISDKEGISLFTKAS